MVEQTGDILVTPGYYQQGTTTDDEIMYSMVGYTQKGVTLKGGQGILPAGCVVGRETTSKKWKVYNNALSDGTEVARGILRKAADTGSGATSVDRPANIVIMGIVKSAKVSGSDSSALTDLGARIDTVLGTYTLG